MEAPNEIIVRASDDKGAVYGVKKCAEILFKRGEMMKGEGLMIVDKKTETLDPEKEEIYKFLGIEQRKQIDNGRVMVRIRTETQKRLENLVDLELYDKNFMKAINCRVIPIAEYAMNVCQFTKKELYDLDMLVKKNLRRKATLGRQGSDERLYMTRQERGGLKSLRQLYKETKLRVATYIVLSPGR